MVQDGRAVQFRRDGNAFFATLTVAAARGRSQDDHASTITAIRRSRKNPPWQGGFTWAKDSLGRPWVVTTDQGMGASVWWPNKDTQADEPDSQRVALTVPDPMMDVSNGRLRKHDAQPERHDDLRVVRRQPDQQLRDRRRRRDTTRTTPRRIDGVKGKLTMDFWPLDYNLDERAPAVAAGAVDDAVLRALVRPVSVVRGRLQAARGAEHRAWSTRAPSRTATGIQNGYRKRDGSGTGLGLKWDFIIVHESAHEWFGNNITAKDNADMWVHESFANYAEGIYTECQFGKEAGARVHRRQPPRHPQRPPDHSGVRRERPGLGRHVPEGRRDAAHHPPDRRATTRSGAASSRA